MVMVEIGKVCRSQAPVYPDKKYRFYSKCCGKSLSDFVYNRLTLYSVPKRGRKNFIHLFFEH